jgi:ATPase subunit of ABC transporter with duplicated ATPase domains
MPTQQNTLTYEGVLELFRQNAEQMKETDRRIKETERMIQENAVQSQKMEQRLKRIFRETDKKISELGSRIGEIIEYMIGGGIVEQFQALNIAIKSHSRDKTFGTRGTEESGQIDVFLENGDVVILIEVKTKLTDRYVRQHIKRLKKYRLYGGDKRRILGAVAGAVVSDEIARFAHKQGLYVIVQSGEAVEIMQPPEGFKAKEW